MRTKLGAGMGLALATALVVAGCSDAARPLTAPERSESEARALLGGLTGTLGTLTSLLIAPVQRTTPLANDVTWSFTAGPGGGFSSNSAVGLTIAVPAGALSSTVTITVTALAGAPVAYRFQPHLEFGRKVSLTQNLRGTTGGGLLSSLVMKGAHFAGDVLQLNPAGLAIVDEIVPAFVLPWTRTVTFGVEHFSGWILASGNEGDRE